MPNSGNIATISGNNITNSGIDLSTKADLVGGKIPSTQLPSYVDDVQEYANLAAFPATGETGIIYVAIDTNKIYRWSGSTYIEIASGAGAVWGGITGTLSNQTDLQNALNAKEPTITAGTTAQYYRGDKTFQTLNTAAVAESVTNLYYTDARARAALSSSATGLTYTSGTGVFSLTAGYVIPTTTEQTNWGSAYTHSTTTTGSVHGSTTVGGNLLRLTNPSAITFLRVNADNTVSTLDAATFRSAIGAGTSSTTGTVTSVAIATGTTGADINISGSPINGSGTITINIPTASGSARGLLSSADWTTFNGKQAALNGTGFVRMSGTTPSYVTGTSSQFVKADGSLDGSTYVTGGPYLPLAGGTMTGPVTFSGATAYNPLTFTGGVANYSIAQQDGAGRVNWYWNKSGTGGSPTYQVSSEDALRLKFSTSQAAGTEAGIGVYWAAANTAGVGITWIEVMGAFHNGFRVLAAATFSSTVTATQFIRSGGTSSQVLLANGSVVSTATANTASTLVLRDGSGNFSAGTITATLNGNASSATNSDTVDGYHQTDFLRIAANSSSPTNGNFAIGNASSRNFIQSHSGQPLDINPLGNQVFINGSEAVRNTGTWGISISGNADTVDGYHASTSTIANGIVVRDGNGYIFGNYINTTDDVVGGSVTGVIVKQGDNYHRTGNQASIRTFLGLGSMAYDSGSYLPIAGGTVFGRTSFQVSQSGTGYNNMQLETYTYGTGVAGISFHRGGYTAVALYHDGDGLKLDGNKLLTAGNYNSYSPTLTGGGASGTWGINITGTAGSETLSTVTNRGNTTAQNIVFTNGRKGLVGVYDPAQTQAIFAMGASYMLTDGGASNNIGPLYGLAWSYNPNYGGAGNNPQSIAGLNHQLLLMQNGITTAAMGSGMWTSGNVTGAAFYGAGTGLTGTAASLSIGGNADTVDGYHATFSGSANTIPLRNASGYLEPNNWIQFNGGYGLYDPTNGAHFVRNERSYGSWKVLGERNGWRGLHFGEATGMTLMMNETEFGFHREGVGWQARFTSGTGHFNISGNAATITGQANSATITASTGVNASHIVQRDGSGYIYASHINFNTTETENPTISSFITSNGDGWSRKSSLTHAKNQIRGVADGTWAINVTGTASNITAYSINQNLGTGNSVSFNNVTSAVDVTVGSGLPANGTVLFYGSNSGGGYWGRAQSRNSDGNFWLSTRTNSATWFDNIRMNSSGVTVYGTFTNSSDALFKTNIETIPNALNKVLAMRGVSFNRIEKPEGSREIGFVAQELLPIIPEVVHKEYKELGNTEEYTLSVSYVTICALLTEAIKEQQVQIEAQKSEIEELKELVKQLINK